MISIKLDKKAVIENMTGMTSENYIAYRKYIEGLLAVEDDVDIQEINNNINAIVAYQILKRALHYTPIDTGKLRNSSYIKPYAEGFEIGYTCEYATYVHEIGVNYHKSPTQYKYLEDAAFEVFEEYEADMGIELNITIEYNPLRIFVGVENSPGESLTGVKYNEYLIDDPEEYQRIMQGFLNYDEATAQEADRVYFEKLSKFMEYYGNYRHMSTMSILREWIDIQRHN